MFQTKTNKEVLPFLFFNTILTPDPLWTNLKHNEDCFSKFSFIWSLGHLSLYKSQNYVFVHNFYSRRLFGRHKKSNYLEDITFRSRASCKTKCQNVPIFYKYKNFLFSLAMRCVPYVSTPLQLSRHYVSGRRVRPIAC